MGFSTLWLISQAWRDGRSQSLSGWDGVFNLRGRCLKPELLSLSQSLSGWDGVFNLAVSQALKRGGFGRNPFQGGMGFSTDPTEYAVVEVTDASQSLSGWDGVFDRRPDLLVPDDLVRSQSLSGWDGVFD